MDILFFKRKDERKTIFTTVYTRTCEISLSRGSRIPKPNRDLAADLFASACVYVIVSKKSDRILLLRQPRLHN